jgi:hypothetical protein
MPASWLYFGDGRPWTWVGYVKLILGVAVL